MHYLYILRDKENSKLYIGYSHDVAQRLKQHRVNNKCLELIYYEAYQFEKDARCREQMLKKYGSAWRALRKRLAASLQQTA
jgi:putative endonuclease